MSTWGALLFQISPLSSWYVSHRELGRIESSTCLGHRRDFVGVPVSVKSHAQRFVFKRCPPCARLWKKRQKGKEKVRHDWEGLIAEFESRAESNEIPFKPPPSGVILRDENVDHLALLPAVETAACTALTFCMWYLGRIYHLDSFLLLFYPIPMFFVTMRWGPMAGDRVLVSTLILVLTMMGPLYSILYFFNTGVMAMIFSRVLWNRWHWVPGILAGGLAKGVGLALQFTWASGIVRYNSWKLIAEQVKILADTVGGGICGILKIRKAPSLTIQQIQFAVAVVLVLHSVLHVLFTYLASTMILDRLGESIKLKRNPRMLRVLELLKEQLQRKTR